jgi:hypothetical protein
MEDIEKLIEQFRSAGGKCENFALEYREESGFYGYSKQGDQQTIVLCPAHLLVNISDVDVNNDGLFISNPAPYRNYLDFLTQYFAFHFNRNMLCRYIEIARQINSLSNKELGLVSKIYPSCYCTTGGESEIEFAKKLLLKSHYIKHLDKNVLMPFVSFLNYSKFGQSFSIKKDSISLSGKFRGEIFAKYNMDDALWIAGEYGFITDTSYAYSLPMTQTTTEGTSIIITHKFNESTVTSDGLRLPLIHKHNNTITISWFPLYFEGGPMLPARVAKMVANEAGLSAAGFLYRVFRDNLNTLTLVAFQLRESENPFAQLAAKAAQRQLELIGGTRE